MSNLYFLYKKHKNQFVLNALVNKNREVQDELGIDFIKIDVTENKSYKEITLKVMPHVWELNGWWIAYVTITFAWAFQRLFNKWSDKKDKKLLFDDQCKRWEELTFSKKKDVI